MHITPRIQDTITILHHHEKKLFWLAVSIIACFYLYIVAHSITTQPLLFDEGWVLQAPLTMAATGQYASLGAIWDGNNKLFDPYVSTGPAVLLPTALVFKVFGTGVVQARLVMVIFYLAVIVLMAWYVYRQTNSKYSILAVISVLLVASPPVNFRLDVLGEFPAIAYALAALLLWQKNKFAAAGVLAGLAILSKSIMLFLLPAAGLLFLYKLYRSRHSIKPVLFQAVRWGIGAATPIAAWELFKFIQLGGYAAYKYNWIEYIGFFKVTGSGLAPNGTILTVQDKFNLIVSTISMPRSLVLIVCGILVGLTLLNAYRGHLKSVLEKQQYALAFIVIYLTWWFLKSNGGFSRYVVPLAAILIAVLVSTAFVQAKKLHMYERALRLTGGVIIGIILLAGIRNHALATNPSYNLTLDQQQQIAQEIKASNPSALTHLGFWQNPEILFMTNLHSKERGLQPDGMPIQLLLSPTMSDNAQADYIKAQSFCEQKLLDRSGYIYCQTTNRPF